MELHDMQHLAKLSRLSLSDDEAIRMQSDITLILGYIDQIQKANVPAIVVAHDNINAVRDDIVVSQDMATRNHILDQSPKRHEDFIQVQKVISR